MGDQLAHALVHRQTVDVRANESIYWFREASDGGCEL